MTDKRIDDITQIRDALSKCLRIKRTQALRETDHIMLPDYPLPDKSAVIQYRQKLRDITKQKSFPETVTWPEKPEEIKSIEEVSIK